MYKLFTYILGSCDSGQQDQLVWLWNGSQKATGGRLED